MEIEAKVNDSEDGKISHPLTWIQVYLILGRFSKYMEQFSDGAHAKG